MLIASNLITPRPNSGRAALNRLSSRQFTGKPRVFIDNKYNCPIVDQRVVCQPGCLSF
jgi:hypothetical protein